MFGYPFQCGLVVAQGAALMLLNGLTIVTDMADLLKHAHALGVFSARKADMQFVMIVARAGTTGSVR